MKKRALEVVGEGFAIKHKNATLYNSGHQGTEFFDIDRLLASPTLQKEIIDFLVSSIESMESDGLEFDKLAFIDKDSGPTGMLLIASSLSQILNKEITVVRRWRELRVNEMKSTCSPVRAGDQYLLIDDVGTTGASQSKAIDVLQEHDAHVSGVLCFLLRNEEAFQNIRQEYGIENLRSVLTYDDLKYAGYVMPDDSEDYFEGDYIDEFVSRLELDEAEEEVVRSRVEQIIEEILDDKNVSASDSSEEVLENIYFNLAMFINQDGIYSDRDEPEASA